ncbi:CZB domain-containing protein [Undibacterium cyanobacteriorum]|uniref:CZB domain-containing protein n=1 Tax=Undibacterium cyanobacteriorum TaxID=3073561 RepID=A0ABY9RJB9_9BURK|nr:CZB domain-containing protein [Undibacterium sp. 20NA77.5]WMW81323.1 CZB domain-containing protein [Undibacterium sp. 20NA77.5]
MNLDNAVETHAQWKTKLRSAIVKQEKLDHACLSRDDCCELGQWLHGVGQQRYGRFASHAECVTQHRAFHREVAKVAMAVNAGRYEAAQELLASTSDYAKVSSELSVAFLRLRKEARI